MNYAIAATTLPPLLLSSSGSIESSGMFMNQFWIYGKVQVCL
jgi:hypothetical protein